MNSSTGRDEDRALLPEGRNDIKKTAMEVKKRNGKIQKIFTSPYRRAVETAEIIYGICSAEEGVEILKELSSGTAAHGLVASIKESIKTLNSVILVGHMPDLGYLADCLINKPQKGPTSLKAGAMIKLEIKNVEKFFSADIVYTLTPEEIN